MADRPARLVVVDDDEDVRQQISDSLREEGLDVLGEAADGETGLDLAGRLRPDVVIADLRMPGLGGIDMTRRISTELPGVRVVILTAYDDQGLQTASLAAGAWRLLVKGCSIDDLLRAVDGACRSARGLGREEAR
jgi:two-component system, NarL family, invasion response regulator UvrY